ncbi:two component regulator with propeller domain [Ancylomarina subtilis]|uniref:histidine kinase n=1 Tax=Ancylomarina subtilis TaxID=1639035 RepID=A0A4Q7VE31_9BACT|nr:two-component regulator propeller domain-containing protein [Ancylomarina subtilis]RZT93322.1 two component regulator with propeller domain [Ancylomarina subtilis]
MYNLFNKILISLFLLTLSMVNYAQQYSFTNYSLEQGLPQSEVSSIIQDKTGNLWLGTNGGGLSRFNGQEFFSYNKNHGLEDNNIRSLFKDSKDNIWIGTSTGISLFNGIEFINYNETDSLPVARYFQIQESNDGKIWALGIKDNQRVLVYIQDGHIYNANKLYPELSTKNRALSILNDPKGKLLITTQNALYEYEDNKLSISKLNDESLFKDQIIVPAFFDSNHECWYRAFKPNFGFSIFKTKNNKISKIDIPESINPLDITNINLDSKGRLWICIKEVGLAIVSDGNVKIIDQSKGLISPYIQEVLEDNEGNIWLTTSGNGLIKYGSNKFLSLDFTNIIGGNIVLATLQDSNGYYWFSISGKGIVRYKNGESQILTTEMHPSLSRVIDLLELDNGKILIASENGLLEYQNGKIKSAAKTYGFHPNTIITDICTAENGIWFAVLNNGLVFIDKDNKRREINSKNHDLTSENISNIFIDSKNRLWLSHMHGVSVLDGDQIINYDSKNGLSHDWVLQTCEDKLGRIWAATFSGGLSFWDDQRWTKVSVEDGLSSEITYSILTDKEGNIWAGTQNGVDRISIDLSGKIDKIRNYDKYDGFIGIENNGASNYIDKNQNLWFGTVNGAMVYNPSNDNINITPPIIQLTSINLFFKKINWNDKKYKDKYSSISPWFPIPQKLELTHDMHHLTFNFEALSYKSPEKVKYKWILEGLDKEWSPITSKSEAIYSRIPPGTYTLKIKASNSDGIWTSTPYEYTFTIQPPWWLTWWFLSLLVIFLAIVVFLTIKIRLINIRNKQKVLEIMVFDKTKEIRLQKTEIEKKNEALEEQKEEILQQSQFLQKSYMNLIHLSDIGKIITANLSFERIIDSAYQSVKELMDASIFGIGVYDKSKKDLYFPRFKEDGNDINNIRFDLDDPNRLAVYCYKNEAEVFINDLDKEASKYIEKVISINNTHLPKSVIYLPLKVRGKVIGVITVQSYLKNAFKDYHLSLLQNIAVYASIAIENAQVFQKIELQAKWLQKANNNINLQKEEILRKNSELTELNHEKNHLIGIIAHDLKNPLTSTLTIAEYLKSQIKNSNQPEDVENIDFMLNALTRMNKMITRILDVKMIESKSINLQLEKINLSRLLNIVNQNFKEKLEQKHIKLNFESTETYVEVDPEYMTQVYENLISNAIKFSPSNKEIWVKVWEDGNKVKTMIKDEGPGISLEDQKRMFGKFQVLSAKPTAGERSTGLGLSIVKKYIEAMDGKVWCESEIGRGSNFIIEMDKAIS